MTQKLFVHLNNEGYKICFNLHLISACYGTFILQLRRGNWKLLRFFRQCMCYATDAKMPDSKQMFCVKKLCHLEKYLFSEKRIFYYFSWENFSLCKGRFEWKGVEAAKPGTWQSSGIV